MTKLLHIHGHDSSMEIEMAWISPVVLVLQSPMGIQASTRRANHHAITLHKPRRLHVCEPSQLHTTWANDYAVAHL